MRGRKPKRNSEKLLTGSRYVNAAEPVATGVPVCPAWLSDPAQEVWQELVPGFIATGVVRAVDTTLLVLLCNAVADYREAQLQLELEGKIIKTPSGHEKLNPQLKLRRYAEQVISKTLVQLGLTPAERGRLSITQDDTDDLEDYI